MLTIEAIESIAPNEVRAALGSPPAGVGAVVIDAVVGVVIGAAVGAVVVGTSGATTAGLGAKDSSGGVLVSSVKQSPPSKPHSAVL